MYINNYNHYVINNIIYYIDRLEIIIEYNNNDNDADSNVETNIQLEGVKETIHSLYRKRRSICSWYSRLGKQQKSCN